MPKNLAAFLLVGAGGMAGSMLRYALALTGQRFSISFPHGTLWANLAGCFLIGLVTQVAADTGLIAPTTRLLLTAGFCGGLTTLSSMIYELGQMLRDGEWFYAWA